MSYKLSVCLLLFALLLGCTQRNQSAVEQKKSIPQSKDDTISITENKVEAVDTAHRIIYDFMKIVIADQALDTSYGLSIDAEPHCDLSDDDEAFLETLMISKPQSSNSDSSEIPLAINPFELPKVLTKADVKYMLSQEKQSSGFKWDVSRLGFSKTNHNNWYCFSVPLFSVDKRRAVMMVRRLCPGLCGVGWQLLFIKKNNRWTSSTGGWWIH